MQKLRSTFFFSSSSLSLFQSPRVFLFQNRIAKIYILLFFLLLFFFCFSSTSPPILIDPHQSYVFIVEVAVNLWSPHYCRFSLSLSLPRIRVACASGSPPVPAPFRRLLSSDFPLFRRFSSCLSKDTIQGWLGKSGRWLARKKNETDENHVDKPCSPAASTRQRIRNAD